MDGIKCKKTVKGLHCRKAKTVKKDKVTLEVSAYNKGSVMTALRLEEEVWDQKVITGLTGK